MKNFDHGHWWWTYSPTDRQREPTLIADAGVHETYFTMLSHQFNPMRTFKLGPKPEGWRDDLHTSWSDLITDNTSEDTLYTVKYIVDSMLTPRGRKLYRVRWEGYDGSWDTWEDEDALRGGEALEEYLTDQPKDQMNLCQASEEELPEADPNETQKWTRAQNLRCKIMTNRIGHGINKLTAHVWESI